MSVFKSYLRQLIRQLKALQKAHKEGNKEEVERIINELLKDAQDGLEDDQGVIYITIQQKIDMACAHAGISKAELSRRLGYKKPQSFQTRYDTGKFTQEELQEIAQATGGKYISVFQYPDGTEI